MHKCKCKQSWEGPVQNYVTLPRICEQFDLRLTGLLFMRIKKKTLGGFLLL